jgi:predicted MFS family arabinose efflux permease
VGLSVGAKGATLTFVTGRLESNGLGTLVSGSFDGLRLGACNGVLVCIEGVPEAIVGTRIGAVVLGLTVCLVMGIPVGFAIGRLEGWFVGISGFLVGTLVPGPGVLVCTGAPEAIVGTRIGAVVVGLAVCSVIGIPVGFAIGRLDGWFVGISGFLVGRTGDGVLKGRGVGGCVMLAS